MSASWRRNRLTSTLGIEYPVIQGPLGGLSSQKLTAAVSNFGGLGSFGAHSLVPSAIDDAIAQIRSLTSTPFAVRHLSVAAATAGRSDLLPPWAGQSAGLSACTDVSVFLQSLLEEVSAIAGPIGDWSANYRAHHPAA